MDGWLTIREIAAELGAPESNLRYYRDRISEFLPSKGRGRKRRYSREAAEVFRGVLEMVREGVTLDDIYIRLAAERPAAVPNAEPQQAQNQQAAQIIEMLSAKIDDISRAVEVERKNAALEVQVQSLSEEVKVLKQKRAGFIEETEAKNKELLSLRMERDHLTKKLRESDAEKGELKNAIAMLKNEIAEKERVNEKLSGAFAEAMGQELRSIKSVLENFVFRAKGAGGVSALGREEMPN